MTTMTDPPQGTFRLSMLINDTRYRSYTFQFIALIVLIAALAYLMSNLFANLAAAGLNISYNFLGEPAGYDVQQTLIEYTSQSTHLRAAWVGIINTLLVAFMACVTATILGVIAGVLRLSKNWLVSKLMSAYVEAFRNVPVLVWILVINTVVISMPAPRAYRGETPSPLGSQTMLPPGKTRSSLPPTRFVLTTGMFRLRAVSDTIVRWPASFSCVKGLALAHAMTLAPAW